LYRFWKELFDQLSYGRNGFAAMSFGLNVLRTQCPSDSMSFGLNVLRTQCPSDSMSFGLNGFAAMSFGLNGFAAMSFGLNVVRTQWLRHNVLRTQWLRRNVLRTQWLRRNVLRTQCPSDSMLWHRPLKKKKMEIKIIFLLNISLLKNQNQENEFYK
jgi:hypothetical protein